MSKLIEVFTVKEHRFNKKIIIGSDEVYVNSKGIAEVEPSKVSLCLINGFELLDKNVEYPSLEDQKSVKDVGEILDTARKSANDIVNKAKLEAKEIVDNAKAEAEKINRPVTEKIDLRKKYESLTVGELRDQLKMNHVSEEKYKKLLKKEDLIDLLIKLTFEEE